MPPIRKGDGTAVSPKGISQVRTGDGRILFDGPDIVTQYQFEDDTDTSVAIDSVGNYDSDLSGPSYTTNSKCGDYALDFDGSGDTGRTSEKINLGEMGTSGELSIAAYVKHADTTSDTIHICEWSGDSVDDEICIMQDSNTSNTELRVRVDGDSNQLTYDAPIDEYHHVALTADNSGTEMYIDGELHDSMSYSLDLTSFEGYFTMGGRWQGTFENGRYWAGTLDNVTYAHSKLSQEEVQQLVDQCD